MTRLRRALPWVAVVSLLLQAAIGGVSLSAMALAEAPVAVQTCTCFHGAEDHGQCPMHHSASGEARCRLRGLDDAATAALSTLLAPLTPAVPAGSRLAAPVAAFAPRPGAFALVSSPVRPDLRPPRA